MADSEPDVANDARPRDLTTGPIAKTLLLFALPTLGANVLQSLNGTINAIWIGNFLGEAALAATANANNIMFLMFSAVFGLAMATTILIGQSMGARDVEGARRVLGSSIGLIGGLAVVIAAIGITTTPGILHLLATPDAAKALAGSYLRVIFLGMPFSFMTVLLSAALRGAGDSITPFRAMVLGVLVDAGLNPFLIKGIGPFPEMGVAGSALATLISGLFTTVFLIVYAYRKNLILRLRGPELGYLRPTRALASAIIGKGLPMGLSMIVLSVGGLAMMGLVNRAGVDTAAAFGAVSQLWAYVQMPAMAVGAAVTAMAAQNIGAGRWDRVDRIALSGSGINIAMTGATVVTIFFLDRQLLGLFLTGTSPAVPIGMHIHGIVGWSFLAFGVAMVLGSVMRANGAVIAPLVIMLIAFLPVRFGFALVMEIYWGVEAIWWSYPLGSVTSLVLTLGWYRFGGWRQARMLASEPVLG